MKEDIPDEQDSGSGAHSLAGYDYQLDVSIWLALDLMLGSSLTQMVELEPGSEEDLEAQLVDDDPEPMSTRIELDGYTLVVQVKLRGGDAWSISDINRLLQHGSPNRLSAAQRLSKPEVRYLLVTSAALNGQARTLRIKRAGSWPSTKNGLPASTQKLFTTNAAGRIAIIDNLDEDRLVQEIKRLLIERFGIPNSRWIECLQILRREASLRVRRVGHGQWHREDLNNIIRSHDGYLASSPQLEDYVYPRNWKDLRDALGPPNYAALIIGQSGTGKTLATRKIYEELRLDNPGLTRVAIRCGPQQLRDDRTPPPVLYDIEDPWGRYDFDSESRHWNDDLARCMSSARADRIIIATSRRDVAMASGALRSVEQWTIPLEAEQYGNIERQRLYRTRIKALPRDIRLLASNAEKQVLDKLATPLEIEKFFDALRIAERSKKQNERHFISDAIDKAHEHSIELTVIQQIEERSDIYAAAVIWAFLKTNDRISIQTLRSLELELGTRFSAFEKGLMPLIDFFVAARNLRSSDGQVSYYHPRVEAGIEGALKRAPNPSKLALVAFIDVLTSPDGLELICGPEVAARLVTATKRIPELSFTPKKPIANQIDIWLSNRLADPSCSLREYMNLAAEAGSANSNAAEFARYLLHRPDQSLGWFNFWRCPDKPEAWYERLRADSEIASIANRFIREILPDSRDYYSQEFVDELDRLAPHLTPAYLDAAKAIVHYGCTPSSELIAIGALRSPDDFEPILDIAIEKLTLSEEEIRKNDETRLSIINDVYNSDYAQYLSDNDDGYTAWEFLKAYADRARKVKDWKKLATHRHAKRLLPHWMHSFMDSAKEDAVSQDEMAGAFAAAFGSDEESALWFVLRQHWNERYLDQLISRVYNGSPLNNVRRDSLSCLIEHAPNYLISTIDDLHQAGQNGRIIELVIDLALLQNCETIEGGKHVAAAIIATNHLSPELQEICKAANSSADEEWQPLSETAKNMLKNTISSSPSVREFRILRHKDLLGSIREDIEWILTNSDEPDSCIAAIEAAITLDLHEIITDALNHRFSHVAAKALAAAGKNAPTPLPAEWLVLASSKGSPVRKALVHLLSSKTHPDHLPALLSLAQDQWSSFSQSYGDDDYFPIARFSVEAISKLESLDAANLEQLQKIALNTSDRTVRANLFKVIAAQGGHTFHKKLFDLAVAPGRIDIRHSAACAMLANIDILDMTVIGEISADLLITLTPTIAAIFTLIAAYRTSSSKRIEIARDISANVKRRGLLLLMLQPITASYDPSRSTIEKFLPENHPSLIWLNSGPMERAEDSLIADLGDPAICREILQWLNPKEVKP